MNKIEQLLESGLGKLEAKMQARLAAERERQQRNDRELAEKQRALLEALAEVLPAELMEYVDVSGLGLAQRHFLVPLHLPGEFTTIYVYMTEVKGRWMGAEVPFGVVGYFKAQSATFTPEGVCYLAYSAAEHRDNLRVNEFDLAVAEAHKAYLELAEIEAEAKHLTAESLAEAQASVREQDEMPKGSTRAETPEERLVNALREVISGIVYEGTE
jgi:hypothetical protein